MKNKCFILILSFLFILIKVTFCQNGEFSTRGECPTGEDYRTYRFSLVIDDENYVLNFYECFCDIVGEMCVSSGKCERIGNEIILKDAINGYEITLRCKNKRVMRFVSGFSSLKGKTLKYVGPPNDDAFEFCESLEKKEHCDEEWNELLADQIKQEKPSYGLYRAPFFRLEILEDGRYKYSYYFGYEYIISLGTWSMDGNLIAFQDDEMTLPFYAINLGKQILGNKFPCSFDNTKFEFVDDDGFQ